MISIIKLSCSKVGIIKKSISSVKIIKIVVVSKLLGMKCIIKVMIKILMMKKLIICKLILVKDDVVELVDQGAHDVCPNLTAGRTCGRQTLVNSQGPSRHCNVLTGTPGTRTSLRRTVL